MRFLDLIRLALIAWVGLSHNINAEIAGHLAEHHHEFFHERALESREHLHSHASSKGSEGADLEASSHEHFGLDSSVFTLAQARDLLPEIAPASISLSLDAQTAFVAFPGFFHADLAYSPPPWRFRNLPMLN